MSRDRGPKHKKSRREGVDLYGTGGESLQRRLQQPPGMHGRKTRRRESEYSRHLREKQKVKRMYGLQEKQFLRFFEKARRKSGETGVAAVAGSQWATVNVGDARILVQGLAVGLSAPFIAKTKPTALRQVLAGDGIVLSSVAARNLGRKTGDVVRLATPTGYHSLIVRDVVDYVAIDSGSAAISLDGLRDWFDRPGATFLQVGLKPGADAEDVRADLELSLIHISEPTRPY